ncbi:MAG TPA: PAS domain S-box protein [Methylomirabilota bacterium]|nr:PAS domain S-box protein [Methylomirabilota bacterium]
MTGSRQKQDEFAVSDDALQEREARLRSILEAAPDAIIVIDERGIIESFSPAAERLFGFTADEAIGRNVNILMPSPYHERHDGYIGHYLRTGERRIIGIGRIVVGQRKDGSTFPMELAVGEALHRGRRIFTGFVRDLTERQLADSRLHELQSELLHISRLSDVGQMASALAHELNQPLAAIVNYVQAMRRFLQAADRPPSARVLEVMDKVVGQAARAGEIIRHLRSFIRKGEAERRTEDLNKVVEEATALGLVGAKETGIAVRWNLSRTPLPVFIDKVQIQQVIFNLVRNSIEAMVEHPAPRDMLVATTLAEPGMAAVSVSDSGPGLAPSVQQQLFQPFITTKEKGMGLGLSICRSIVDAHGGRLQATPNPDRGVTFSFTLPLVDDVDSEAAE